MAAEHPVRKLFRADAELLLEGQFMTYTKQMVLHTFDTLEDAQSWFAEIGLGFHAVGEFVRVGKPII